MYFIMFVFFQYRVRYLPNCYPFKSPLYSFETYFIFHDRRMTPNLTLNLDAAHGFIQGYQKELTMIYERDPESPFSKILVKNGSSIVGTIRRNLITGYYHFYDDQLDELNGLFQEKRIDTIKMKIETLNVRKAS